MKSKTYLGYIFAILSGLLIIGSAFLSLNITYIANEHTQGNSLFNIFMNLGSADLSMKIVAILYIAAIAFALVLIVYSLVALILTTSGKKPRASLITLRILSCVAFAMTIAMFVYLGVALSLRETPFYNFVGIGPAVAVLGSLFMILSLFMVKKPLKAARN